MTATGVLLDVQDVLEAAGVRPRSRANLRSDLSGGSVGAEHRPRRPGARGWPVTITDREALPPAWRVNAPGRMGDLVLTTVPPLRVSGAAGFQGLMKRVLFRLGREFGGHGYDPELPEMGGIFLAVGRGVPAGTRLGAVHQVDVAPTAAALLGIAPPAQSEGRAWFDAGPASENEHNGGAP